jgi:hypothetical protein
MSERFAALEGLDGNVGKYKGQHQNVSKRIMNHYEEL